MPTYDMKGSITVAYSYLRLYRIGSLMGSLVQFVLHPSVVTELEDLGTTEAGLGGHRGKGRWGLTRGSGPVQQPLETICQSHIC